MIIFTIPVVMFIIKAAIPIPMILSNISSWGLKQVRLNFKGVDLVKK